MMTVTNAFSPHLLPSPVRHDINSNQPLPGGNHVSTHALRSTSAAVVQTPQKYFCANFSAAAHLSHPNSVVRQMKLPASMLVFNAATSTSSDLSSFVANRSQPFELMKFPAAAPPPPPCVDQLTFLPQRLDGIDTATLPCHFNTSSSSTHFNLLRYRDAQIGVNGASALQTKPPGKIFQTLTQPDNASKNVHYQDSFQIPLNFVHPNLMIQKHQYLSHSNTVTGKDKPMDIDVNPHFKESQIAQIWTHSKVLDDSKTRCKLSPQSPMSSEKFKTSSGDFKSTSSSSSPSSSPSSLSSSPPRKVKSFDSSQILSVSTQFTQKSTLPNHSQNLSNRNQTIGKVEIISGSRDGIENGFSDNEISRNKRILKSVEKQEGQEDIIASGTRKDEQRVVVEDSDNKGIHADVDIKTEVESPKENVMITEESCTEAVNKHKATSLPHSIESILRMKEEIHNKPVARQVDYVETGGKDCGFVDPVGDFDEGQVNPVGGDLNGNVMSDVEDDHDVISVISDGTIDDEDDVEVEVYDELCVGSVTSDGEHTSINSDQSSVTQKTSPLHDNFQGNNKDDNDLNIPPANDSECPEKLNKNQIETADHFKMKRGNVNLESSPIHINEHLKRLEGLITKEDTHHFQKDEFYQAKLHILHSVSKNCKLFTDAQQMHTSHQHFGPAGGIPTKGMEPTTSSVKTPISLLPPFQSLLPLGNLTSVHQCNPFCPCHQNPGHFISQHSYRHQSESREAKSFTQRTCQKREEGDLRHPSETVKEESQKSAFRPILRKHHHHPYPIRPGQSLSKDKTGSIIDQALPSPSLPPQPPQLATTVQLPAESSKESLANGNSPSETPNDSNSLLEDPVNLDAISLLRFRSNTYQSPTSLPSSFTYSSSPRPNPEAVNVWLSWLRSRNCGEIRNAPNLQPIQGALTKAPPPPRYHCGDCNKTYSTYGGLSKHRQFHCTLHVKKEFACKICTKSYSSLGALKMHIRTHTLPCKCHICGKAFSRPWLLQGHVRTHTGEKPFRCNHCGRAFADRSNLRAHLQTHAEIKKYACVKCGKTFSRMSLLTKHSDGSCPANVSSCL